MTDFPIPVTRFAPSPSGYLHLGHAYSALLAYREAQKQKGVFLLRIEDIDITRCKDEYIDGIYEDLKWLGLEWPEPVLRQSEHFERYDQFLHVLEEADLVYPCFCTRKEIQAEIAKSPSAPHGPDGALYPGTCKYLDHAERKARVERGDSHAWRIHMDKAVKLAGSLTFKDRIHGEVKVEPETCGDVVLARKDVPTSYHLSVVIDDALQHVSLVVRGEDLLHATHIHRILQTLLGFPEPEYLHHELLTDENGKRFAKRDKSLTIKALRENGLSKEDVIRRLNVDIEKI
ncbi:tRNA glutamyl-Q(34) synthetase GluQRS [Curvivirga aplysinae]|uniref:tRNA glutamyl-Q(34) synthetase GluQRS n=1 Tax=Curvivirga aplysinae TaxID=2529852 RepID=UPI0012BC2294|nr:tRNA glutamyl-Q(34) synthetase GluQRS [Curvivirga aplysinae]